MEPRINPKVAPGIYEAMFGLGNYLRKSGLEESLVTQFACGRRKSMAAPTASICIGKT